MKPKPRTWDVASKPTGKSAELSRSC
jgi:hypothetical protein